MSAQTRFGIATTVTTFLVGIWLVLSPFVVEFQQDWTTLTDATKNTLWSGGALVAVSSLTLFLFLAFALRDAAHEARRRNAAADDDGDR